MIPDFPDVKKEISKAVNAALRAQVKQGAPMLAMLNTKSLYEGDKLGVLYPDGREVINPLRYVESGFTISKEEMPKTTSAGFMEKMATVADDMAGQIERGIFATIDESIKDSGNTIPGNPPLTPETILTALEMVAVDFEDDDREKPVRPSIVTGPEGLERFKELEAAATPEEKKVHQEKEKVILDKKYVEYMSDLDSRKIVD